MKQEPKYISSEELVRRCYEECKGFRKSQRKGLEKFLFQLSGFELIPKDEQRICRELKNVLTKNTKKILSGLIEQPTEKNMESIKKAIKNSISESVHYALCALAWRRAVFKEKIYKVADQKTFAKEVGDILLECFPVKNPKSFFQHLHSDFSSYVKQHQPIQNKTYKLYSTDEGICIEVSDEVIDTVSKPRPPKGDSIVVGGIGFDENLSSA